MPAKNAARQWITPLTMGTFIVSAVTGILLMFHIKSSFIFWSHEWISLAFVIGVIIHCVINFTPLKYAIVRPKGAIIVIAFVAITTIALFTQGQGGDQFHRHGGGRDGYSSTIPQETTKMTVVMINLPLNTLAAATGHTLIEISDALANANIIIENQSQTLMELASHNGSNPEELLNLIL